MPTGIKTMLFSIMCGREHSEWHQEDRRWRENWERKQEKKTQGAGALQCAQDMGPQGAALGFQLRGAPSRLDTGKRPEEQVKWQKQRFPTQDTDFQSLQQTTNALFGSWSLACGHSHPSPDTPYLRVLGWRESPMVMFCCCFFLFWNYFWCSEALQDNTGISYMPFTEFPLMFAS